MATWLHNKITENENKTDRFVLYGADRALENVGRQQLLPLSNSECLSVFSLSLFFMTTNI